MTHAALLSPEWERIDLLGACLSLIRRGEDISVAMKEHLQGLQKQVNDLRQSAPWQSVIRNHDLNSLDQDILACAIAPEAEPRLGWMYQELQPGLVSAYPTQALIRDMFFIDAGDAHQLRQRLHDSSPLIRRGLIQGSVSETFQPLVPTSSACAQLLGWPEAEHQAPVGAVEIPVTADWNALVVPPALSARLKEFLLWVTHWDQVVGEWGARAFGGPVALFAGPSGTGKTFAAEVLAYELGWPLYRVDMGLLVSKYIGETEKNLNALFDSAHEKNMILLFDEADSLFGKRGEVKDARDRYANMEVSHLLSRMERHRGPCILTSNLRKHLDPAFARRFHLVVEFPRPDAAARGGLWRLHMPPRAPIKKGVDFEKLGTELPLTGGQIRNAAIHAAFLAASEANAIGLEHIASAVWTELAKEGRELMPSMLGSLAAHLPKEEF